MVALLTGVTAQPALAQAPAGPGDASGIAPPVPSANIGEDAASRDYLLSARAALVNGHTGQAQFALAMAESRERDRAVPDGPWVAASDSRFVAHIRDARHALSIGDQGQAIQLIDSALAN
jgi:hypothetical protein